MTGGNYLNVLVKCKACCRAVGS